MKTSIRTLGIMILVSGALFSTSCKTSSKARTTVIVTNQPHKLPPGQAKKVTGSQSAAPYAPGQQKKKGGTTVVVKNK